MIDKNVVKSLVEEWLQDTEYFLVDLTVSADDRIVVEDCAKLSQFIEDHISRDEEDYELEVGSAGLGQPFKVRQQYENRIGSPVEVLDAEGRKVRGVLKSVDGDNFVVTVNEKVKVEGKKRPVKMDVDHTFNMENVKYTKYLINFK